MAILMSKLNCSPLPCLCNAKKIGQPRRVLHNRPPSKLRDSKAPHFFKPCP